MTKAIEQLKRLFGEEIPFTTYLYNINTGSISIGDAPTLVLKENVYSLDEDELFVYDRINMNNINMKSSEMHVILKKETLLAIRYQDILLFCIEEAADLFRVLLKRAEMEQYKDVGMPLESVRRAAESSTNHV